MRSRQEESTVVSKWVRPILTGTIIGAVCCLIILMLFAAVLAAQDIPQMAVTPMAVAAAAIGAFIGGMVCARIARVRGLIFGAACGLVLYLVVMIAGFAMLKDIRGWFALVKLLIMTGCGAIGGVIGVNIRKR